MPAVNPLLDPEDVAATPAVTQASRSGALTSPPPGALSMNPVGSSQQTAANAAGTSENVALHVATIIALALLGIYALRASGFRFVAAGSIGVGR